MDGAAFSNRGFSSCPKSCSATLSHRLREEPRPMERFFLELDPPEEAMRSWPHVVVVVVASPA